ncbi:MAG: alpha-L-fucosidase [Armatimonadota bacterium]
MEATRPNAEWFRNARYGLFVHYGLYSLLGRGEWAMNRERIPKEEYAKLAGNFTAENFDADALIERAKSWGMRYAVLTTKHHDGFCLYDSKLTGFTSAKSPAERDLVAEFVAACRRHGLRVGLYHSLNDWSASPDAVDALERPEECYQRFIDSVHARIREIMTNYGKIDVLWYDGWWPFNGEGWQANKLNAMVRELQPHILLNGRCGLEGDFLTPEQHISSSHKPWEACVTLNDNWGYHKGDCNWKSPKEIAEMLRKCAAGCGNLLLNIGLKGDGSIPNQSSCRLDSVGAWLEQNAESIYGTDRFEFSLRDRGDGRSEWNHSGGFTAAGNSFYWHIRSWPGDRLYLAGVKCTVTEVTELSTGESYTFTQDGDRVLIEGLPEEVDASMPTIIRLRTIEKPMLYLCGGWREPNVPHCHYDPLPSDIL